MAEYVDYTGKQFGHLVVMRLAQATDICHMQDKSRKIWEWVEFNDERGQGKEVKFIGRNKYWYCICNICDAVHIVRADHLGEKKCKCQK